MTATLPELLRPLNELITPALRLGVANPLPLTGGLVLLETRGRRSGKPYRVPLLCADYGAVLVLSTVREASHWVANLMADPEPAVWLRGHRRRVRAAVFQHGSLRQAGDVPRSALTEAFRAWSRVVPGSVAVLTLTAEAGAATAA